MSHVRSALALASLFTLALATACDEPRSAGGATRSGRDAFVPQPTIDGGIEDASERADDAGSVVEPDGGTTSDRDASATDARSTGSPDASSNGSPDASFALPPTCVHTCSTPADCVIESSPLYGADNYACTSGRCEWRGCTSTTECVESLGAAYTCATPSGGTFPSCVHTCTTPSDCVTEGSPLTGADNYACDRGLCQWTGCTSDDECQQALQNTSYRCVPFANTTIRTCLKSCTRREDCIIESSPLYDADNYACTNQLCEWTGCTSTAECTTALQSASYVCH